jgi:hypothetical protein
MCSRRLRSILACLLVACCPVVCSAELLAHGANHEGDAHAESAPAACGHGHHHHAPAPERRGHEPPHEPPQPHGPHACFCNVGLAPAPALHVPAPHDAGVAPAEAAALISGAHVERFERYDPDSLTESSRQSADFPLLI